MKKFKTIIMACFALLIVALPTLLYGCGEVTPTLELKTEFKTEYYIGEALDTTNGFLTYTNKKGEKIDVEITSNMVAGFNSDTAGEKTMTVAYEGLSITVDYEVKSYVDVNLERLYYVNPSIMTGNNPDLYATIYFDENKQDLYIHSSTNADPKTLLNDVENKIKVEQLKFTYQKSIVEGKAVYVIVSSPVGESVSTTITITVKNPTTISVNYVQGTISSTEDYTMYDGVQYGKLYYSHQSALTANNPANSYDYVYFANSTDVYVWSSSKTPEQFDSSTDLHEQSKYTYTVSEVQGEEVYTFSTSTNNIQIVAKDINTITLSGIGTQISFDLSAYNG